MRNHPWRKTASLVISTAHGAGEISSLQRFCHRCGAPWVTIRTIKRPSCMCPGLDGDSPGSDCANEDNWPYDGVMKEM